MQDIELTNVETGTKRMFRFDHAKSHLTYESGLKRKTWVLPPDSKYTFEDGNIITSGSDTVNQGTKKHKRVKGGEEEEATS